MAKSAYGYSRAYKLVAKDFKNKAGNALTKTVNEIIRTMYFTAESEALMQSRIAPYSGKTHYRDKVRYYKSFRLSTGKAQSGANWTSFSGSGYKGPENIQLGKLEKARYISLYNIASVRAGRAGLFRYSYLVDKSGWSRAPKWGIIDITAAKMARYYPFLKEFSK